MVEKNNTWEPITHSAVMGSMCLLTMISTAGRSEMKYVALDLRGKKVGRLTVVSPEGKTKWGNIKWRCVCECGNETVVAGGCLHSKTKSCGCLNKERVKSLNYKHGMTRTPTYIKWRRAKDRCYNINVRCTIHTVGEALRFATDG